VVVGFCREALCGRFFLLTESKKRRARWHVRPRDHFLFRDRVAGPHAILGKKRFGHGGTVVDYMVL
jgi:hypothetical protein